VQPEWGPDGALYWVSDRDGWWNLYRDGEQLTALEAELGYPMWIFGMSTYGFLADGRLACTVVDKACIPSACSIPGRASSNRSTSRSRPPCLTSMRTATASRPSLRHQPSRLRSWSSMSPPGHMKRSCERPTSSSPRSRSPSAVRSSSPRRAVATRTRSTTRRRTPTSRGRGRAAAALDAHPRRPDLAGEAGVRPRDSVSDQPRLGRRRRELRRLDRVRPSLPGAARR
jgi:hypothetical protein